VAKMLAVVNYSAKPESVELREVSVPEIGPTDVLLRVGAVGVCGSDVHQWKGRQSWKVKYPCVLGHEFCGTVATNGSRVHTVKEGDRVVSETAAVINQDSPFAHEGRYNIDPSRKGFGYGTDGAMATYVAVPERCLHKLPDNLPFDVAALTEPACVAFSAVCVNTRIVPGDLVVVIGPGPIGLLCAALAKFNGAGTVIMLGLPSDKERLELACSLGADAVLDGEVSDRLNSYGDGYGADIVIDAAGVSATLKTALEVARPGAHITKVGWGSQPIGFSLDLLVQKAISLQGSFSHTWKTWERVISLLESGKLPVDKLISRTAPLELWHDCFEGMHNGTYVKAVLRPGD
jgi:2-desacetyl-2-hydroxyethyl bacteriochlorophyllide A dehydrogenase